MLSFENILDKSMLSECKKYNPDNVFKKIKLIEFPITFVGLSTTKVIDIENDLSTSVYLKTMCMSQLLEFNKARDVSGNHRAFEVSKINNHSISVTFIPRSEIISKLKQNNVGNRCVFDLRIIQVDGTRCCNSESHSEIGRFYISGEYENCCLTHFPKIIDYGHLLIQTKESKYLRLRNQSHIAANVRHVRVPGSEVTPEKFVIPANSSKKISITIKPFCLLIKKQLMFEIRNPHDITDEQNNDDDNFLSYIIDFEVHLSYNKTNKQVSMESLHKIYEPLTKYTYLGNEKNTYSERKCIASTYIRVNKSSKIKNRTHKSLLTDTFQLDNECLTREKDVTTGFCKNIPEKISILELIDICFLPFSIDFGKVGINTYAEQIIKIRNRSRYDVVICFDNDCRISYTTQKFKKMTFKLMSLTETQVTIICQGFTVGNYEDTFNCIIDNKYHKKYQYRVHVGNPTLLILDKNLKFGMLTNEHFVTSVPVKIFNNFNVDIEFNWENINQDTPFKILPISGTVRKYTCNTCDILYVCKNIKTKTHEVNLSSNCNIGEYIPLELNVITKKLSIKFLQPAVFFKEIALNVETITSVTLENSSREIALFHVVEPLIHGFTIKPMSGILRPKMVMNFDISVKISCIMEFAFDVIVKINNRENITLPVSGTVSEPKLLIQPRHIYMTRIPCNMITYVPVTIQNISTLKTFLEIVDTGNENIFDVYIDKENEKIKLFKLEIESGESKTIFIKIYDIFRREYDMYMPFKINGLLGPPDPHSWSTDLQNYSSKYVLSYQNNPKVKIKDMNKDIPYCRIAGVITIPWIEISVENFEIDYKPNFSNDINFLITNVSKYRLFITIITTNLRPNFKLSMYSEEIQRTNTETNMKFELDLQQQVQLKLKFNPKANGKFVATALLYLDKNLSMPYYNLTFIGKRFTPVLTTETDRIIFSPCIVGEEISRTLTLQFTDKSSEEKFSYTLSENPGLFVQFIEFKHLQEKNYRTVVKVEIKVCCQQAYSTNLIITFLHECGSHCNIEVSFCATFCPLTLHTTALVSPIKNPYPFYPRPDQTELYNYLEKSINFLEKWMFYQGFRRDLYPIIPDTFHILSTDASSSHSAVNKGINVSYLNFMKRISGPMMKHIRKAMVKNVEDSFKYVEELHDTYKQIIHLLKSRGADIWFLQAIFLLNYEQFTIYIKTKIDKVHAGMVLNRKLLEDKELFDRLNKQSWLDFILQTYKVFIMDSCFFDCVCLSSQPKDIIQILTDWFNEQISLHYKKQGNKINRVKTIKNITSDLSDGVAIMSSILNHCPFLQDHFSVFHEDKEHETANSIINNACLIIEAMNLLKLYFPLKSEDFIEPNFVQMFFLSIHLYVTLPMLKPRDILKFKPPLLRCSSRLVTIAMANHEAVMFNYTILNNTKSNFYIERTSSRDNAKNFAMTVKYVANFVDMETRILLLHGHNKTRIFDTYIIFILEGYIGSLNPIRKCKVTSPLYRANKVDILVSSPFQASATYQLSVAENEPTIPVNFDYENVPKFHCRRINLIDKMITLSGIPKDSGQDVQEHKLYLQVICLSTQIGNTWIWFRSDPGDFFIKVTSQPRWDLPIDTLQARLPTWPLETCSCGEICECYRTTAIEIPHRNELMLDSLRSALSEHASDAMLEVYDNLIETPVGKIIISMLLLESGTNMSDIEHIFRSEMRYRITSRSLSTEIYSVKLAQHTETMLVLPITIPADDKSGKYSITLTSECGTDIRTYKIAFVENEAHDVES